MWQMKKRIGVVITLVALILCSCGNSNDSEKTANTLDSSADEMTSVSDNSIENIDVTGIYLGEQGSGLILYDDGKADYLFTGWNIVDEDCIWDYGNGVLTVYIPEIGYDIYAEISVEDEAYIFKSENAAWIDESFIKTTSVSNKLTVEEFKQLYAKTLGTPQDTGENYNVEYGGMEFVFPLIYQYDSSNDMYVYAESEDEVGIIAFKESFELNMSKEELHDVTSQPDFLDGFEEGMDVVESVEEISVCDEYAIKISGSNTYDGTTFNADMYAILNTTGGKAFLITMMSTLNTRRDCQADFDKIIETATLISEEISETQESSSESDEVTVSFKEMLDSYEEFMDEYIEFMKKYSKSNDTTSMLTDYLNYLQKYAEFAEKIDAVDESSLSPADEAYYIEVTARVSKKLIDASISLQ
jgi:hypothetical protein